MEAGWELLMTTEGSRKHGATGAKVSDSGGAGPGPRAGEVSKLLILYPDVTLLILVSPAGKHLLFLLRIRAML